MDKASLVRMAAAALAALKLLLQAFGIELSQDTFDAIADVAAAGIILYAAWKNNYLSSKGKKQQEVLRKSGLL